MRAIDTNVLVRLLALDDDEQVEAANAYIASGGWVSKPVLVETMWVMRSVFGREHNCIADSIEMLLSHESLFIEDPEVVAAALANYRTQPSLRFSDCVILESARKAGHLPLGTFDRDLAKLDGAEQI